MGWGLPESLFAFMAFWRGLTPCEQGAVEDYAMVSPTGLLERLISGGHDHIPKGGLDPRLHYRYYSDPPEFLTTLNGEGDGHHYGLWYDDPSAPAFVASYYNNDHTTIDPNGYTLLEAVRASIERRTESEIENAEYSEGNDEEALEDARDGILHLSLARDAVCEFETIDRTERGAQYCEKYSVEASGRIPTVPQIGVAVPPPLVRPQREAVIERFFADVPLQELASWVEAALEACRQGQPAEALALGHDIHWLSGGDGQREAWALSLLEAAYPALGRPALAEIAAVHHRHRDLPDVDLYVKES
jgi:Uncharacterised conserved protein (DUF2228)